MATQFQFLSRDKQEAVTMFCTITGADQALGLQFVEACSWNTQVAIDRYFNNPDPSQFNIADANGAQQQIGGAAVAAPAAAAAAAAAAPAAAPAAAGMGQGGNDFGNNNGANNNRANNDYNDSDMADLNYAQELGMGMTDDEMRRQLQVLQNFENNKPKTNYGKAFSDKVWLNACSMLNVQDFTRVAQTCHHLYKITNASQNDFENKMKVNNYWQSQTLLFLMKWNDQYFDNSNSFLNNVKFSKEELNWHHVCLELRKLVRNIDEISKAENIMKNMKWQVCRFDCLHLFQLFLLHNVNVNNENNDNKMKREMKVDEDCKNENEKEKENENENNRKSKDKKENNDKMETETDNENENENGKGDCDIDVDITMNSENKKEKEEIKNEDNDNDLAKKINGFFVIDGIESNETPLYVTCRHGCENLLKYLLTLPIDIGQTAGDGNDTPLLISLKYKHFNICQNLLQDNRMTVNIINHQNNLGNCALLEACSCAKEGNQVFSIIEKMLAFNDNNGEKLNINIRDKEGKNGLWYAVDQGSKKLFRLLIKYKINVKEASSAQVNGKTLLMMAAQNGRLEMIEELLEHGCDIMECSDKGYNVLSCAAMGSHSRIIMFIHKYLTENEISQDKMNKFMNQQTVDEGYTPYILACKFADRIVIKKLTDVFVVDNTIRDKSGKRGSDYINYSFDVKKSLAQQEQDNEI